MHEMPEVTGDFRPDADDRKRILIESKDRLAESTDALLAYRGKEISDQEGLDRFFGLAGRILNEIEYVNSLHEDDDEAAATMELLMESFGYASFSVLGAGENKPWAYGDLEVDYPVLSDAMAVSEELSRSKDVFFQRARNVLARGFGERYAESLLGADKSALLRSKGIDPHKNPLGYASFGDAVTLEQNGREMTFPAFMIRPSEKDDKIFYRPSSGNEFFGKRFEFNVDVSRLKDEIYRKKVRFVAERPNDSDPIDPAEQSYMETVFSEDVFPEFLKAFRKSEKPLHDTRQEYLPVRIRAADGSVTYRRIIRSGNPTGYAIIS
jgi:hypothetical protein